MRNCGQLRLAGEPLVAGSVAHSIERGLGLVPEDRKRHGIVLEMSVRENIGLAGLSRHRYPGGRSQEAADTKKMVDALRIKTPSTRQIVPPIGWQSAEGGDLALMPRVLLLDELDVGAKEEIYR